MSKKNFQEKMTDFAYNAITKNKLISLGVILLLLVFGILGVGRIEVDTSNEAFFPKDDPVILENEKFNEIFSSQDFVFVMIESEDVFSYETLKYIDTLSKEFEKQLPFISEVRSITRAGYMGLENEVLTLNLFIDGEIPNDQNELNKIREKAMNNRNTVGNLVSEDQKYAGIALIFKDIPDKVYADVPRNFNVVDQEDYELHEILTADKIFLSNEKDRYNEITDTKKLIIPPIKKVISENPSQSIKTYITGMEVFNYEGDILAGEEMGKLALLALLFSTGLMLVLFRSLKPMIGVGLVLIITLIILFGIFGWFGIPVTMQSIFIIILIMVISISYSIHVINHFEYELRNTKSKKKAVLYAYKEGLWPIFVTAITTSLGFLSFAVIPVLPIRMIGISCAVGSILSYFMVMIIIPTILKSGKDTPKKIRKIKGDSGGFFRKLMSLWADFVAKHLKLIVVLTAVFLIVFGIFAFRVENSVDFFEMIGQDIDYAKDAYHIRDKMGFVYSYDIFIEFPEANMALKSENLKTIEQIINIAEKHPETSAVGSINILIKEINQIMNQGNENYYAIPNNDQTITEYLKPFEMISSDALFNFVNDSYDKMRISILINEFNDNVLTTIDEIQEYAEAKLPKGTKVHAVGEIPLLLQSLNFLDEGNIRSIALAITVITFVMFIILKSIKLGLISIVVNVIPIFSIWGLMGLTGIPLDFFTIMITPMILGIAVDDAVHYFLHFKEEFDVEHDYLIANRITFQKIGKALISTTIIIVLGFGVFTLSNILSYRYLGIIASVGIFSALVSDLCIAPALVKFFKPFGNEEKLEAIRKSKENKVQEQEI